MMGARTPSAIPPWAQQAWTAGVRYSPRPLAVTQQHTHPTQTAGVSEPDSSNCAIIDSTGFLADSDCATAKQFTCRLAPSDCPPNYVRASFGGGAAACYRFMESGLNWADSQAECATHDPKSALVTVDSPEEFEFVSGLCNPCV